MDPTHDAAKDLMEVKEPTAVGVSSCAESDTVPGMSVNHATSRGEGK